MPVSVERLSGFSEWKAKLGEKHFGQSPIESTLPAMALFKGWDGRVDLPASMISIQRPNTRPTSADVVTRNPRRCSIVDIAATSTESNPDREELISCFDGLVSDIVDSFI